MKNFNLMSKQSDDDDFSDENYTYVSIRDDIISMTFYRTPINNSITVKFLKICDPPLIYVINH